MCILSTCLSKSSIGTGCRPDKHKSDLGSGRNLLDHQYRLPIEQLENCSQVDCLQKYCAETHINTGQMCCKSYLATWVLKHHIPPDWPETVFFYNSGTLSTFKTRNVCVFSFALLAEGRWCKRDVERQIF